MAGLNVEQVSVLDVADDDELFTGYCEALARVGIEATHGDRALDTALRTQRRGSLLGLPAKLEAAIPDGLDGRGRGVPNWDRDQRRAMVALTWPDRFSLPVFVEPPDLPGEPLPTLRDRTYNDVFAQTTEAIKILLVRLTRRNFEISHLTQVAQLHLIQAAGLQAVPRANIADLLDAGSWRHGYLFTWEDLLPLVDGLALTFSAEDVATGAWACQHRLLRHRVSRIPALRDSFKDAVTRLADCLADDSGPGSGTESSTDIHDRITGLGHVQPPSVGTKYRPLFELLDSSPSAPVPLDRAALEAAMETADGAPRGVRGARGVPGLPAKADLAAWWALHGHQIGRRWTWSRTSARPARRCTRLCGGSPPPAAWTTR